MKADIYGIDRRTDNVLKRLEESQLSSRNVELLRNFYREKIAGDLEKITVQGNLECFKILDHVIDFDLDEATREDLVELVATINRAQVHPEQETSPWTLLDYKRALKNFYKWHTGSEDPEIISFMSVYVKDSKKPQVDPAELIGVGDAENMINTALNPRDKALFGLLWDTGARISELLNIDVRDITFDKDLMGVNIRHGKTGPRKIYCVESKPLITNWLKEHPTREPKDPLFTILQSSHSTSQVKRQTYRSVLKQLNANAERADIPDRKRVNPHGWRRARATDMARKGMNQPTMNRYFGWVRGSQVPKYYIRLAEADVKRSVQGLYPGLEPDEKQVRYLGENIPMYDQADLQAYKK